MLLSLVLPTFNECGTIGELIERIEATRTKLPVELAIVVVDDNSNDGTANIVKSLKNKYSNISLIQRPSPSGLGSAYLEGFNFSMNALNADFFGEMDSDLQHPPETLIAMCNSLEKNYDVVLASRYIPGGSTGGFSLARKLVSKGANLLARLFLRLPVKDATTGFRVISARSIRSLFDYDLSAKGYAFQVESLYVYKKCGMTFSEVPFAFGARKVGETKLNSKEIFRFAATTIKTGIFGLKKSRATLLSIDANQSKPELRN